MVSNKKLYSLSEFSESLLVNLFVPKFIGNKYAVLAMFFSVFMLNLVGLFLYYYLTTATILIPVVINIAVLYYFLFFKSWLCVKVVSYYYAVIEVIVKPAGLSLKKQGLIPFWLLALSDL